MSDKAVVVGGGRIGSLLRSLGPSVLMTREGWPKDAPEEGPIYVCTRNDALEEVIEATPEDRRKDLVFLQNGWLLPFLEEKGMADASQALIYFAVAKQGDMPIDGVTDLNPEGLTTATGKWARALQSRLAAANLTCLVKEGDDFLKAALEKHIWICAFMVVGASHNGCTVGEVLEKHEAEFDTLANQLAKAGEQKLKITLDSNYLARLKAYGKAVAHFPTAVKEFQWRNGWFYQISVDAIKAGLDDPVPMHTSLLYKLKLPLPL